MNPELLAPLMFLALLCCLFAGFPVAFSLGGVAMIFGGIGIACDAFGPQYLNVLPIRLWGIMNNQTLLAVPFFIAMGTLLEKSNLAEDLLRTVGQLFGPVRGGLALAVVLVGALLAAATGVVGASVVSMGMISLPIMLRYKTNKEFATGVIAASGTLGQIIPPSVVLIVLGDQLGVSVGDLFKGALVPGLMLAGLFALFVLVVAWLRPDLAPALPLSEREFTGRQLARRCLRVMLPPLVLILLVLGSIFIGLATPTEAGAVGAVGAFLLAAANRRLTRERVRDTLDATVRLTTMVAFLLAGSTAFIHVFRGFDGDLWIENLLLDLPGGKVGAIVAANVVIFLLGFFIDFFEIAFIVVPLLAATFQRLGIDLVWFGVMVAMNLQTSFLTPPFGFALFYLKGVCPPEVKTKHIYRGVLPFIGIQLIALLLVILFPELVTWAIQD